MKGLGITMGILNRSTAPSAHFRSVTPDDDVTFNRPSRGVYVGSAGTLSVRCALTGDAVDFEGVPAGTLLPICVDRILETGSGGAGAIVVLW